jgi:hypothetical protein
MPFRRTLPALLLVMGAAALPAQAVVTPQAAKPAQLPADSMELARKYTTWFYNNQLDSLVAHMDSASRSQGRSKDQLQQNLAQLADRGGTEVTVIDEKFITRNGVRQYWRTAKFSNLGEPLLIRWVMNAKGEATGFGLGLHRQAPAIDP